PSLDLDLEGRKDGRSSKGHARRQRRPPAVRDHAGCDELPLAPERHEHAVKREHHPEHGFTAVELIAAIAILTIIVVPVGMGLVQAMKVVPQSDARTTVAAQRFFLTDAFAHDTANAATVDVPVDSTLAAPGRVTQMEVACPTTLPTSPTAIYKAQWADG